MSYWKGRVAGGAKRVSGSVQRGRAKGIALFERVQWLIYSTMEKVHLKKRVIKEHVTVSNVRERWAGC
jgi:hypothetical protein